MSWRWLVWSLFSPSQVILVLLAAGGVLLAVAQDPAGPVRKAGRKLCVAGAFGLLVFGVLPSAHYFAYLLEARFPRPELPARVTGIVLLTGAERAKASDVHGEPQVNWAAARYTTALRLATKYPEARVVVTGGPAVDPVTGELGQTGVAMQILSGVGIDPSRLTFEKGSLDTCDNATNTKALVRPKTGETWVVVTSALHMPRAVACFRAVDWTIIPQPADYHSVFREGGIGRFRIADNLVLLDVALHEWAGLVYYRLAGRTGEFFPSSG